MALAAREVVGIGLSAAVVIVLFRTIGTSGYGIYGVSLALTGFLGRLGALGIDVYVVRQSRALPHEAHRELLGAVTVIATVLGTIIVLLAGRIAGAFNVPESAALVRATGVFVWSSVVSRLPLAILEQELRLRVVAGLELASLLAYTVVVIPLALAGVGYWSVGIATIVQGVVFTTLAFRRAPVLPSFRFHRAVVVPALRYGVSFQASAAIWALRDLAGPVLIGRNLGQDALGIATAAFLISNRVSFFRQIVWRVSLAGLAKVQDDAARLRRAISEGMLLQIVALAAAFSVFAVTGPWLVPAVAGREWEDVMALFPFIAVGILFNAVFTLHSSMMFARQRMAAMTVFHLAHVGVLWLSAAVLVPRFGLLGYGYAELAALSTYVLLDGMVSREIGRPDYAASLPVVGLTVLVLFSSSVLPFWGRLVLAAGGVGLLAAASRPVRVTGRELAVQLVRGARGGVKR